jgi:hypothetical protein
MTTIFNCADCRKAIKENSREHDDCWTDMELDDDLWYCGDCKCDHMPNDDDFDEEPFFKTEEEEEEGSKCGECGISTQGRKIRSLWNNSLCEKCGEESDDEEEEEVVCPRCDRTEKECEEQAEDKDNKNPITDGRVDGWGLSCDECYYKNKKPTCDDCGRAIRDTENLDTCWTNDGIIFWCEYCREEHVEEYIRERDGDD